jgi:hypothetical protein
MSRVLNHLTPARRRLESNVFILREDQRGELVFVRVAILL